jgi:DnaJ homolog subfamily A member 5
MVFQKIYECENRAEDFDIEDSNYTKSNLISDFGTPDTPWEQVAPFYQVCESFSSILNYSWADLYDINEAPNRQYRRAMDDENKKARRNAKRERNEEIIALVHFVKRRDIRVKAKKKQLEEEKNIREQKQKEEAAIRKLETQKIKRTMATTGPKRNNYSARRRSYSWTDSIS